MAHLINRKREREADTEIDVSCVTSASPACSQGAKSSAKCIPPFKRIGNTFFDGQTSDGLATMRFVGYDSKVRRRLVEWEGKDAVVTISKCEIKCVRHDADGLEVNVKSSTKVAKSEKVFDVSKGTFQRRKW